MLYSTVEGSKKVPASMVKIFIPPGIECQTVPSIKQSDFQRPAFQVVKDGVGKHGTTHLGKFGKMSRKV